LHSKVYEPSSIAGSTILLEFNTRAYDPSHEPYRSELAVTATASLANALYQMNQQVGLVTNGRDAADRSARRLDFASAAAPPSKPPACWPRAITHGRWSMKTVANRTIVRFWGALRRTDRQLNLARLVARRRVACRETPVVLTRGHGRDGHGLRLRRGLPSPRSSTCSRARVRRSGRQIAEERIDCRHLKDENSVGTICRAFVTH
jgi:uncharacterized protein (DUF58 family)